MNRDSRTHNSLRNLFTGLSQKIISIILTFVSRQIFLQVLTIEYLGLNSLFSDIFILLSVADMGLATAMAHSFYKPIAENDERKLAALTGFYRRVFNIIALIVSAAGAALTPFLGHIVNLENDIPYIEIYYLITLATLVMQYLVASKIILITSDQKKSIVIKYGIYGSIVTIILQIIGLLTVGSYMLFVVTGFAISLAINLLISLKADRLYPFIKLKVKLDAADKRTVFLNMKSMFIYRFADVLTLGTTTIFISILVGTAFVGMYTNYALAVTNLKGIAFIIFNSISPSIGNMVAAETAPKRLRIFKTLQMAGYWLSGFFAFCLFFLLDDFVSLWLGAEFVFGFAEKALILLGFYLSVTLFPVVAFRDATGMYQKTKYFRVASAVIKITFAVILGSYFGVAGILLASIMAKLFTIVWYEPIVLFRDFFGGTGPFSYFKGLALNSLLVLALIAAVRFFLPWQASAGWPEWIFRGVFYTLLINLVYFVILHRTPEFRMILSKIKKAVKEKGEK